MIKYPTLDEVEQAHLTRLAYWIRFLPPPGSVESAVGEADFDYEGRLIVELAVLQRVMDRVKALGGITPEVSKLIGWGEQ